MNKQKNEKKAEDYLDLVKSEEDQQEEEQEEVEESTGFNNNFELPQMEMPSVDIEIPEISPVCTI